MRYTDPRILTTLILGMLFTGVFAYAAYTASLDSNVFQAPTIKADAIYVGAQTIAQYILDTNPTGPYNYIIENASGTYKCYNGQTGAVTSSSGTFITVWNAMLAAAGKTDWSCRFISGDYTVGAQMLMDGSGTKYENVYIDFGDATFTLSADLGNAPMFRILGKAGAGNHSHHITLRGGHFNVNSTAAGYKNAYGVSLKWVDYALIDRVHVYNARDDSAVTDFYGIGFTGADADYNLYGQVTKCLVEEVEGPGIIISNSQYFTIDHNTLQDCVYNYPAGGYIQADTSSNADNPTAAIDGLKILDNKMIGTAWNDGCYLGSSTHFAQGAEFSRNYVKLVCQEAAPPAPLTGVSGIKAYINDIKIQDNRFDIDINATTGCNGINSYGTGAIITGNKVMGCYNGIMANDGHDSGGPFTTDSLNTLIADNSVSGTANNGIYIFQDNVTVKGNRVYCLAADSIDIHNTALNTRLLGNDVAGSLTNLSDSGTGTLVKCHFDKTGAYAP